MNLDKYPYLKEFIVALEDEIKKLEQFGESEIKVFNGELSKIESGEYVYSFVVDEIIAITDDQPIEVSYQGKRYKATFVGRAGNTILISISDNLGEKIPSATLIISPIFLLKALIAVIEQLPSLENYNFNFPHEIIGEKHLPPAQDAELDKTVDTDKIDGYKKIAIKNSLGSKVSFIWGPPGTGKTTTIGKLVEHFLKNNQRVLITSHTNIAVDTALRDVLEKDSKLNEGIREFYDQGKILRLGIHQLPGLEGYPMVFGENISAKNSSDLLNKLAKIDNEASQLVDINKKIEIKLNNLRVIQHIIQKKKELENALQVIANTLDGLEDSLRNQEEKIGLIKQQLKKASENNWFSNVLQGLNASKLLKQLDSEEFNKNKIVEDISNNKAKQTQLKNELSEINDELNSQYKGIYNENINSQDLVGELEKNLSKIDSLKADKRSIQEQLDQLSKLLLNSARVVATTLTKCYLRSEVLSQQFDVVIIDEISMAQIPHLFVAIGMGKKAILVGDFLQLPPITQADTEMVNKWLATNLFDYFDISKNFLEKGEIIPQMQPLLEQYRMHPDISNLANKFVYKGRLRDGEGIEEKRAQNADRAPFNGHIGFLDTKGIAAYCRKREGGSRYTLKNAFIDLYLAQLTVKDYLKDRNIDIDEKEDIVGIVTPYRAQANLASKLLIDIEIELNGKSYKLAKYTEVNTVHKFQGNQRKVIVFDTTDDFPMFKPAPIVDDQREHGDDAKLINVAITRAQDKFLLLGNSEFINSKHSDSSLIKNVVPSIENKNKTLFYESILSEKNKGGIDISIFSSAEDIARDIKLATSSIQVVISDLFTSDLFKNVRESLISASKNGIIVNLFTQLPSVYTKDYETLADETIKSLQEQGIKCNLRTKLRDPFFIIDGERIFCLIDEENITGVQLKSGKGAKEIAKLLNLDETEEIIPCPECLKNGRNGMIVPKSSKYGVFYSCSLYPKCKYIDKSRNKKVDASDPVRTDRKCPECGRPVVKKKGRYGFFYGCSGYPDCRHIERRN